MTLTGPTVIPDQFATDYSISGDTLEVDLLLSQARPVSSHRVWRVGAMTEFGPARVSGVRIVIFQGGSLRGLHDAVRDFLKREQAFLEAARGFLRGNVASGLCTSVTVLADHLPIQVDLSPSLLRDVAAYEVGWSFMGFSCSAEGESTVGERAVQR